MKYLKLIFVLATIVASFFFFNKKISENTLHKMLKNDFRIEVNSCGCFGCGSEIVNVYTENDTRWLKLIFNLSSNHPESRLVEFSSEKENQLSALIFDAIKHQDKGGCTTTSEYKIESRGLRYKFTDSRCSVSDFFNLIALTKNQASVAADGN